jgi:methionyl aminopeptidase
MTLAIEPMVNAGSYEVYMKPDGWTICTADGSLSAYFEHTVAITESGPVVLTAQDGRFAYPLGGEGREGTSSLNRAPS